MKKKVLHCLPTSEKQLVTDMDNHYYVSTNIESGLQTTFIYSVVKRIHL